MPKRYVYIWFRYLATDRLAKMHAELRGAPFLVYASERGKMLVKALSLPLEREGFARGMAVADVRAIFPDVAVFPAEPEAEKELLHKLAEWCLRFTPVVAVDEPDGLILDSSGCTHLWGGELSYIETIIWRLHKGGYRVRAAMADTIGAAWAVAHYGNQLVVAPQKQEEALAALPHAALRLDYAILQRLEKLGFRKIGQLRAVPPANLRRRLGPVLLQRLEQALGTGSELLNPIEPEPVYREDLPCLEPIRTAGGIKIALERLLEKLCARLLNEGKGMRTGIFKGYRIDGETVQVRIGTNRASRNAIHLFKLFELKIPEIKPALGIELFTLEATLVEELDEQQEALWGMTATKQTAVAELLDTIAGKVGKDAIHRYLPKAQYWPERSLEEVSELDKQPEIPWSSRQVRPVLLLPRPKPVDVMVALPDYPPSHFRYRGKIIKVARADGPERIEQEWWRQSGPPRDYYQLEDENGARYWLFRLGLYENRKPEWFLHGFFV